MRLVFGVERRDVYGRLLAYAYIGHRFFNAELVRRGLARTLAIPPNTLHSALFRRLELRAARAGRGPLGRLPALNRSLAALLRCPAVLLDQPLYENATKHLPVRERLRAGDLT